MAMVGVLLMAAASWADLYVTVTCPPEDWGPPTWEYTVENIGEPTDEPCMWLYLVNLCGVTDATAPPGWVVFDWGADFA